MKFQSAKRRMAISGDLMLRSPFCRSLSGSTIMRTSSTIDSMSNQLGYAALFQPESASLTVSKESADVTTNNCIIGWLKNSKDDIVVEEMLFVSRFK
ncbi:hypothetical protein OGATHE_001789 [Ogataea polymorpha]|uniref:Uncharacterized protein n=1 Tax=Ogataea polymorpha TaxID=460523 RepID=A0A9P8PLW2_9ASCO|nr:hypothetical protein OGATHE_001789 [Ogataea polymorpha]